MNISEKTRFGRWIWLLHGLVLLAALGLSTAAILRYRGLLSDWAFDLAFFHNLIANAAEGAGFSQSGSLHEADGLLNLSHAFFLLPLFVPIYSIAPHLETLLVLQSIALAVGAYPLARLCHAAGAAPSVSVAMALLYLVSFPFWRLGLADFRPLTVAIPALLWVAFALMTRRPMMAVVAGLVAALCREEVPILVVAMAAAIWLGRRTDRKTALSTMVVTGGYFLVMQLLRTRNGYYIPFDNPETLMQGMGGFLNSETPWDRPFNHLIAYIPVGMFTVLLEPALLLAAVPLIFYQLFISPYEWWHWTGSYIHHTGPLLAVTAVAAAAGWGRLQSWLSAYSARSSILALILFSAAGLEAYSTYQQVEHSMGRGGGEQAILAHRALVDGVLPLLDQIPDEAAVATDYRMIARLSGRAHLYCYQTNFEEHDGGVVQGKRRPGLADVDYMLVDGAHEAWVQRLEAHPQWSRVARGGIYVLYGRR